MTKPDVCRRCDMLVDVGPPMKCSLVVISNAMGEPVPCSLKLGIMHRSDCVPCPHNDPSQRARYAEAEPLEVAIKSVDNKLRDKQRQRRRGVTGRLTI